MPAARCLGTMRGGLAERGARGSFRLGHADGTGAMPWLVSTRIIPDCHAVHGKAESY